MVVYLIVLFVAVAALVAIIVNRKSLVACLVITGAAFITCTLFLLLYKNAASFPSYGALCRFTIISAAVLVLALLAVTYIGVNMFKKKNNSKQSAMPFGYGNSDTQASEGEIIPALIPGTDIRPAPYGIFGRKPLEKTKHAAETNAASFATQPVAAVVSSDVQQPVIDDATAKKAAATDDAQHEMLKRAMGKAARFMDMGQFVLAEQMYTMYLDRCPDLKTKADVEILMLECRVKQGDKACATERLAGLLGKLRSGEYMLTSEQKQALAQARVNISTMQG